MKSFFIGLIILTPIGIWAALSPWSVTLTAVTIAMGCLCWSIGDFIKDVWNNK